MVRCATTALVLRVTELIKGEPLSDYLQRKGQLSSLSVHQIALQACAGLGAIHASNALHRDIKPEDLFFEHLPGAYRTIKVTDFGLARLVGPDVGKVTSACLGTSAYMAPEVLARRPASPP